MAFDILLLLVLLGTLLCCAITDRAYGKIPNKVLFSSSLVALLLQSQTYQHNALLKGTILLAVIGIILYALHIFSAGDSKLLIFIGLSFPYHFLLKTPFLSLLLIPCFSFIAICEAEWPLMRFGTAGLRSQRPPRNARRLLSPAV